MFLQVSVCPERGVGCAWLPGGVHGCQGEGVCMVARGMCGCWGLHGCQGGMHGCWGACMAGGNAWLPGVCMVAGGHVVAGGMKWGVHGKGGGVDEACVVKRGHAWDMTRYGDTINERAVTSYWNAFLFTEKLTVSHFMHIVKNC